MAGRRRAVSPVTHVVRSTNDALRDAAERLVAERKDLPPGAVLRCFSRSVRTALLLGHPFPEVVAVAEDLTQGELALRAEGLRVPRPRRET